MKIYTHQILVSLLHVSSRHKCHNQNVLSVANIAPSEWFDSYKIGTNSQTVAHAFKFQLKHKNVRSTNVNYCV